MRQARGAYAKNWHKEQYEVRFDNITPIIENSLYQSQPTQQTLGFFNKGVEVDMSGIALVPAHQF